MFKEHTSTYILNTLRILIRNVINFNPKKLLYLQRNKTKQKQTIRTTNFSRHVICSQFGLPAGQYWNTNKRAQDCNRHLTSTSTANTATRTAVPPLKSSLPLLTTSTISSPLHHLPHPAVPQQPATQRSAVSKSFCDRVNDGASLASTNTSWADFSVPITTVAPPSTPQTLPDCR